MYETLGGTLDEEYNNELLDDTADSIDSEYESKKNPLNPL